MAFTYGFYNSLRGDRKYNAEQVSELFDGILADGIIPSIGQLFVVQTASNGMQITVGTGRAWFNHTWSKNDSVMVLNVPESDITRPRYDAVVLEVNHTEDVRANTIKIVSGVPEVNPVKPTLVNTDKVHQYPLAYILVPAAAEEILADDIENMVGRSPTVFASGILQPVPIDDLWDQWQGEWQTWFNSIKLQLSGDIVTNLQYQIDQVKNTDGVKCTNAVSNKLGIVANASTSTALIYLDDRVESIIDAILNMNKFIKTHDFTTAGTHTFTASGKEGIAIIIGGGGGGGAGGRGKYSWSYNGNPSSNSSGGGGGAGGAFGDVKATDVTSLVSGNSYTVVVGSGGTGGTNSASAGTVLATAGGSSSALSVVANGGNAGGQGGNGKYIALSNDNNTGGTCLAGGGKGGKGGWIQSPGTSSVQSYNGENGTAGVQSTVNNQLVYSFGGGGGGGGGGGTAITNSAGTTGTGSYGGSGAATTNGSGKGGSGGNAGKVGVNGSAGNNATTSGSGGGGGGGCGSSYDTSSGGPSNYTVGDGGNGGNGAAGRVVIFERGIFEV